MSLIVVEEKINEKDIIEADITEIERLVLGGTDKHSFLNKGNETQGSVNSVSLWWLLLYIQSTANLIMNT